MTTNKPEVFEVYRTRQGTLDNVVLLADYEALQAEYEKLRKDAERYKEALARISIQVDGNIRECVRDCVNGQPDVQDIYGYCDEIDSIIDAAMETTKYFDGCHDRGPKHYWCALRKIEQLEANQIPEGCVVVPREPTYEMMRAGCHIEGSCERSGECHGDCHCNSTLRDIYRAMIAAAEADKGE